MDFARSEEQEEIAGLAGRILTEMVTVDRLRAVEDGDDDDDDGNGGDRFDREVWRALADAGLLGVALPAELGGSGLGIVEQCLVLEQVGRTVAPVPVLASCVLGALPLATFGPDALTQRWVPEAIAGRAVLTGALVEPGNRTPERPTTVATDHDGAWVLTGVKTCVPAGTVADAIVVPATIDGRDAPGLFLVERGDAVAEPQRVTNGDLQAQLTLEGTPALLITDDPAALPWLIERATIGACAQATGVVGRALELTAAYAKERVQFGRPIATFQAVGQRAADGYIDAQATDLVLWQAAWRLAEGLPAATEVQVAAFWAAEAAHRVGHTAVHIHGGTGVDVDHPIHRYLIASRELELTLGGATDQLLRIGAGLAATKQ